jgi:isoleucyl-tRNA synthetase
MAVKALPKKLDLVSLEEGIQDWWVGNGIYTRSTERNSDKPIYYYLDGPPYCSGTIHIGTAWNKIIKDSVLRYLAMRGVNVTRQPGWDSHGLPIEVQVEKELNLKSKKDIENVIGVTEFIDACRQYAKSHMETMTKQFQRLGVWMDWDDPYITFDPKYMEAGWNSIKKAYQRDLLVQDLRVVHWCPRCETALAEHEVRGEYEDRQDPSVYIKFKVRGREGEYILVWTTTPWTLPSNMLVMVKPDFEYARVSVNGEVWIMALELVEGVMERLGIEDYEVLERLPGTALEGLQYEHPLMKQVPRQRDWATDFHRVVLAEYVDLEEGTGCVHTSPGHGEEDFEVGREIDAPIFCPLDAGGRFTEEGGKYEGMYVKDADPVVLEDLKSNGYHVHDETIAHSYPHCWRCHTPLLFMARKQWFLEISRIKDRIIEVNSDVEWVPEWISERYENGVEYAGDWCLSRNRYWGIPMPIWTCEDCGEMKVVGSFEELASLSKTEIDPESFDPHRPTVDRIQLTCDCGGTMNRVPDIIDVWFDSGIASWSSLGYPSDPDALSIWPADLVIEGSDQVGKWFYSLQATSVFTFDESCYRKVLMHGFSLDAEGRKMSKSLGNFVDPGELVAQYGADVIRYYLLWATLPWEDLKFNFNELKTVQRMFNVFWNVCVFASTYMELDEYSGDVEIAQVEDNLRPEDSWLISKTNSTIGRVTDSLEGMNFLHATRDIQRFILDDLSRWYVRLARDRTWVESDDPDKLACYFTLHYAIERLLRLMAPIVPHLTEEIYQEMIRLQTRPESVHLCSWPWVDEALVDQQLEGSMEIVQSLVESALSTRQKAGIKLRQPVGEIVIETQDPKVLEALERLESVFLEQTNCKAVKVVEEIEHRMEIKPDLPSIGRKFRSKAKQVTEALGEADPDEIRQSMGKDGHYELEADGKSFTLDGDDIQFVRRIAEHYVEADSPLGKVMLDTRLSDDLVSEGLAKEIVRRIQDMRKDLDLDIDEYIEAAVTGPSIDRLEGYTDYISTETRSESLGFNAKLEGEVYTKHWQIEEGEYDISIRTK